MNIPAISGPKGFLYIAASDGAVTAVDSATGKQAWRTALGGEIEAMKLAENGRIIVITRQEGEQKDKISLFINALSDESGVTAWRKELEFSDKFYLLTKASSIFLIREDGGISALNAANGDALWRSPSGGKFTAAPVLFDKGLIAGAAEKKLLEISFENGKVAQNLPAQTELTGPMAVANDLIIYSDQVGNIFAARLATGEVLWKARAGAEVSDISLTDQGILVSSNDNFAYMLSVTRGDRKWKRKFSGRLMGKPVLRDGYGMFVTAAGSEAVILNLSSGKFVNNVFLPGEGYFTGASAGVLDGFALSTSRGTLFYSPNSCQKK